MKQIISFRTLDDRNKEDVVNLRKVLEGAPEYSVLVKGRLPLPADVEEFFCGLPPGKSLADKLVGGFWFENQMIGCIDMCFGYPEAVTAYIGLLLFIEKRQRCGYGKEALAQVRTMARARECQALRIAVMEQNERALKFWERECFVELYRNPIPDYIGDAIVMECML